MRDDIPRRVAVLGGAGAGKSTLARALAERIGSSAIHLDKIVYGPGWAPVPIARVRDEIERLVDAPIWTVEGTYPELFDLILPRADLVLWIEQPWATRLWRSWRKTRTYRGRARPDRPDDSADTFSLSYARTILSFGQFTPAVAATLRNAGPNTLVRRLKGDAEVRAFLSEF